MKSINLKDLVMIIDAGGIDVMRTLGAENADMVDVDIEAQPLLQSVIASITATVAFEQELQKAKQLIAAPSIP